MILNYLGTITTSNGGNFINTVGTAVGCSQNRGAGNKLDLQTVRPIIYRPKDIASKGSGREGRNVQDIDIARSQDLELTK